jgi:hexosaminidase
VTFGDELLLLLLQGNIGGIIAAKSGHDVIMTPTSHCYFDYRQAPRWVDVG